MERIAYEGLIEVENPHEKWLEIFEKHHDEMIVSMPEGLMDVLNELKVTRIAKVYKGVSETRVIEGDVGEEVIVFVNKTLLPDEEDFHIYTDYWRVHFKERFREVCDMFRLLGEKFEYMEKFLDELCPSNDNYEEYVIFEEEETTEA